MALRQTSIVEELESGEEAAAQPQRKKACRGGRYWAITWFKEDLSEHEGLYLDPLINERSSFEDRKVVYMLYQIEKAPDTGRLHIQGFVQFKNQVRLNTLKDLFPGAHAELCKGSEKDNERYCSKLDSRIAGPWTYGKKTSQGKRTDWDDVKELAAAGTPRRDIILAHPKLAPCVKGIDVLVSAVRGPPPLERTIRTWFLYGPTATGKTHRARHRFPDAYVVTGRYYEGKSFDMYDNESALILDEWRWDEWPLTLMDGILDKWRFQLQCRYLNKYAGWTDVIILSNQDPDDCYPAVQQSHRECFLRRLNVKIEITNKEQQVDF